MDWLQTPGPQLALGIMLAASAVRPWTDEAPEPALMVLRLAIDVAMLGLAAGRIMFVLGSL